MNVDIGYLYGNVRMGFLGALQYQVNQVPRHCTVFREHPVPFTLYEWLASLSVIATLRLVQHLRLLVIIFVLFLLYLARSSGHSLQLGARAM